MQCKALHEFEDFAVITAKSFWRKSSIYARAESLGLRPRLSACKTRLTSRFAAKNLGSTTLSFSHGFLATLVTLPPAAPGGGREGHDLTGRGPLTRSEDPKLSGPVFRFPGLVRPLGRLWRPVPPFASPAPQDTRPSCPRSAHAFPCRAALSPSRRFGGPHSPHGAPVKTEPKAKFKSPTLVL